MRIKTKILVGILFIFSLLIIVAPLLLNIPAVSCSISWYMHGLRTTDYKTAYISLIGGIVGVWMAVGTSVMIQEIFDTKENSEKKRIVENIICEYLLDEITKNHKSMTTCDSSMHKHVASHSTVLDLAKEKKYTDIRHFSNEFSTDNWNKYAKLILDADFDSYMIISKIYECYAVVAQFKNFTVDTSSTFEQSGIVNYEKRYDKFCKKYEKLIQRNAEDA